MINFNEVDTQIILDEYDCYNSIARLIEDMWLLDDFEIIEIAEHDYISNRIAIFNYNTKTYLIDMTGSNARMFEVDEYAYYDQIIYAYAHFAFRWERFDNSFDDFMNGWTRGEFSGIDRPRCK